MTRNTTAALGLGSALLLAMINPQPAAAQPDQTAIVIISEDDGFPNVCAQPCYEIEKRVDFYLAGNPAAPPVCGAGENTYIYKLTNLTNPPSAASLAFPGIPLTQFELSVDDSLVASAGFIPGADVAPTLTVIGTLNVVQWTFPSGAACPACLNQGMSSDELFICSAAGPGMSPDNASTTAIILDAPGECLVPTEAPGVGEPNPCTIGFWKNRSKGKSGLLKFFPDTDFDAVVAQALALSMGVFSSANQPAAGCPNFDDLICALESKGNRSTEERARQQLAATLLNLAAGDLFPDNGKCVLFEENNITSNACGDNLSVGDGVADSKSGITSGDSQAEHDALECLNDINNEIGVIQ